MPCVIWYGSGPCVYRPMMVPMIEPIAWPPSAGAASTMTTRRPSRAASSAAETPAIPAPTTQMSAVTVRGVTALRPAHDVSQWACRNLAEVVVGAADTVRYQSESQRRNILNELEPREQCNSPNE